MRDDNTEPKKRKSKWTTSYSKMATREAERRLNVTLELLERDAIPVKRMLDGAKSKVALEDLKEAKERVYDAIVGHLEIEGYPTEANPDFKEANISDLVYATVGPILLDFRRKTGREILLRREKEIVSVDSETGGMEEFVVMDLISVTEDRFVLVIEAMRSSLGEAMKQCLLAMKDMSDNNGGSGEVYGFITTGELWQMLRYDATSFTLTDSFQVTFRTMRDEKEKWKRESSVIVDCMNVALSNGGIVKKDVVASA